MCRDYCNNASCNLGNQGCLTNWRLWIRPLCVAVYTCLIIIALPLMIVGLNELNTEVHMQAWFVAGFFVILTVPISLWGILQHLIHYSRPHLQKYIIRILWMVPIYAVNAWFALRFRSAAIYLDTARECYEAYVIYNFMIFLLQYLQTEYADFELIMTEKQQVKHFFPFCLLPPWTMGDQFIRRCKHGVIQYTVVRLITTFTSFVCELAGVYHEGDFDFKSAWSYLVIINNFSQIWAMYCLVLFYRATREQLKPMKPISKFMCVKAVVFLSFWQAVFIAALVKAGVLNELSTSWVVYSVKQVATGLQDFIICIEMFLASIAHYFSFSHKPYISTGDHSDCCASFLSMWDISDVREDVINHVKHVGKSMSNPLRRPSSVLNTENERTPLLTSSDESRNLQNQTSYSHPSTHVKVEVYNEASKNCDQHKTLSCIDSLSASIDDGANSLASSMNNLARFKNINSDEPNSLAQPETNNDNCLHDNVILSDYVQVPEERCDLIKSALGDLKN